MAPQTFAELEADLRRCSGSLPENLVLLRAASSTNQVARDIVGAIPAESYPIASTLIVAYRQTAGRGRLNRPWLSPPGGGLYCSLVEGLGRRQSPERLPLAVGVALCEVLRSLGAVDCGLKWPNDLMTGDGKLGGILVEVLSPHAGAPPTAIVGFGVNIHDDSGALSEMGGTALDQTGAGAISIGELLEVLMPTLRRRIEQRDGDEVVNRFRELVRHREGDRLRWRQEGGVLEGRYAGLDDAGHLILETAEGRRLVSVGDIIER